MRDLLECVWPAALEAANYPFRSRTWAAAMGVLLDRDGGDFTRIRRLGLARFETAVRREITKRGGQKPCLRIVRKLFTALSDSTGVIAHRRGALERVQLLLEDWAENQRKLADTEARMVAVLEELELTELVTSISGLSAVGAAAILAETGDPTRFSSARALVKHAGLCPRDNASGTYQGKTAISGRGRPQLRLAAWRAVWPALRNNPVLAARHSHLTGRADNQLTSTQARVAVAGSLLRQLHAVITTGTAWDPAIASGLNPQSPASARGTAAAA
jgi:transposase